MLTLRRAPGLVADAPVLDEVQQAAVAHRGGVLRVLGAPGTGKTTTVIEAVVDRVHRDGTSPDRVLALSASRVAAGDLRERITARLGGTSTEPLARTHHAFGPRRPRLWPAPTGPSGAASCGRRRPCAATPRPGCSAAPSRTSSCASC